MSMISEQIKKFRYFSLDNEIDMLGVRELQMLLEEAADTIEELSEKLASANMERSTAYYNDGWIPCSERLPDRINPFQTAEYTVTMQFVKSGKRGKPFTSHASFDFESGKWLIKDYEVIAWRKQIAPYQPKGENNA